MSSLRPIATSRGRQLLPFLLPLALIALAACGGGDKSELPVAEVGDHVITLEYFEHKMNTMKPADLPEGIETRAGKEELLDVMINKEVMAIKAEQLGYGDDPKKFDAAEGLVQYHAAQLMRDDMVAEIAPPTEEEIQAYYANLGRILQISYMIHQHQEDAVEARKLVLGGERWIDVATRFDAGDPGPTGSWTMELKYGTITDRIEEVVFALAQREVTEPLDSVYGYFLIRLEGERTDPTLPPYENMQPQLAQSVFDQKVTKRTLEVREEIFEEYGYQLNESTARILFAGLPQDVDVMPPPPKEEWPGLILKPADLELELLRYADEVWTLRRYYDLYEATNILGRPRRDRGLAGLRRELRTMALRDLMPLAARDRGYMDRPQILVQMKEKREEVMVSSLHYELIAANVEVDNAMIAEYWAENSHLYDKPGLRTGKVLMNTDEQAVRAAFEEAKTGTEWATLVKRHAEPAQMPPGSDDGSFGPAREDVSALAARLLWAGQAEGEVCEPMELPGGVWGIGRVDEFTPPQPVTLVEAGNQVKRLLESQESEKLFKERIAAWRSELSIKTYPERLDDAVYAPVNAEAPAATGTEGQGSSGEAHSE